jgi:hypothetical protein
VTPYNPEEIYQFFYPSGSELLYKLPSLYICTIFLHARLIFYPRDGSSTFPEKADRLLGEYTVSYLRKPP